jgi:PKD domain
MSKVMVGIWSVSRRLFSTLRAAVVLIGLAAAPAAADHPADVSEPGTWAHRLTVRVVAGVLEGYDFGHQPEVPPAPAQASRTRVVDLPAVFRTPQLGRFDDVGGLRPLWGGGPFVAPGTGGFRPRDGDIVMCFERSEARYALFGDHRILLWTNVALFDQNGTCYGQPDDTATASVSAPPNGREVCGPRTRLVNDGVFEDDRGFIMLCLTNERIDPRPLAAARRGNSGIAPFTVVLDGSPSVVPNGVREWHWDFGDGQTAVSGPVVNHQYAAPGSYVVALRIIDTLGLERSAGVMTVTVRPPAMQAVAGITGPASVQVGNPATFDATASSPGSNRRHEAIGEYWWEFGDGQQAITRAPEATIAHSYAQPGTYTARVTVHTLDQRTATATTTITVTSIFGSRPSATLRSSSDRPLLLNSR